MKQPRGVRVLACAALAAIFTALPATLATGQLPAVAVVAAVPAPTGPAAPATPEAMLIQALRSVRGNRLDEALTQVDDLIARNPNYRLAHLIKGDLLLARARPLATMGDAPAVPPERVAPLRDEAVARMKRHEDPRPASDVPAYLLELTPTQRHAVVVDSASSRLYLFRNEQGRPQRVADYYVSGGKAGWEKLREGDQRTPIGVYFVTASLDISKLSDFYGSGAYPISYPNEWDQRLGRNGHGIWLHGTPSDTYARPPRASNGCVVLSNPDLDDLAARLEPGVTPVVISPRVEWVSEDERRARAADLQARIEAWRRDWESRDTRAYLAHYSREFKSEKTDFNAWSVQKARVNAGKRWIKVGLADLSIFAYPGRDDLVVVTFEQDYASDNLNQKMRKRQYWQREADTWKIIYEGAA